MNIGFDVVDGSGASSSSLPKEGAGHLWQLVYREPHDTIGFGAIPIYEHIADYGVDIEGQWMQLGQQHTLLSPPFEADEQTAHRLTEIPGVQSIQRVDSTTGSKTAAVEVTKTAMSPICPSCEAFGQKEEDGSFFCPTCEYSASPEKYERDVATWAGGGRVSKVSAISYDTSIETVANDMKNGEQRKTAGRKQAVSGSDLQEAIDEIESEMTNQGMGADLSPRHPTDIIIEVADLYGIDRDTLEAAWDEWENHGLAPSASKTAVPTSVTDHDAVPEWDTAQFSDLCDTCGWPVTRGSDGWTHDKKNPTEWTDRRKGAKTAYAYPEAVGDPYTLPDRVNQSTAQPFTFPSGYNPNPPEVPEAMKNASRRREADILEAMQRSSSLDEQRALLAELNDLRAARTASVQRDRSLDLAGTTIADRLTPVFPHEPHTASTEWLDGVVAEASDDTVTSREMAAQATVWVRNLHEAVVADEEEFTEQARGKARQLTSSLGESRPAAIQAFVDAASHLRSRQGAGGNYSQSGSFDDAVETARQHLSLPSVSTEPKSFVIHEIPGGAGYRVYPAQSQAPGGFMPPGDRPGHPVATVDSDGNVQHLSSRQAATNPFGQELRDGWEGNPSNYDDDIGDLEGYEMQMAREEREGSRRKQAVTAGETCPHCTKGRLKAETSFGATYFMCDYCWATFAPDGTQTGERGTPYQSSRRTAEKTCTTCGDAIAKRPDGEGYMHDSGTKHDHKAKAAAKTSSKTAGDLWDDTILDEIYQDMSDEELKDDTYPGHDDWVKARDRERARRGLTASRRTAARSLSEIARDIQKEWGSKVNFAAKPYLDAMLQLDSMDDYYYQDPASSIVAYFLGNARSFQGERAKELKAELRKLQKGGSRKKTAGDGYLVVVDQGGQDVVLLEDRNLASAVQQAAEQGYTEGYVTNQDGGRGDLSELVKKYTSRRTANITWDGATFIVGMVRGENAHCAICGQSMPQHTEAWVRPVAPDPKVEATVANDVIDRGCALDIQRDPDAVYRAWKGGSRRRASLDPESAYTIRRGENGTIVHTRVFGTEAQEMLDADPELVAQKEGKMKTAYERTAVNRHRVAVRKVAAGGLHFSNVVAGAPEGSNLTTENVLQAINRAAQDRNLRLDTPSDALDMSHDIMLDEAIAPLGGAWDIQGDDLRVWPSNLGNSWPFTGSRRTAGSLEDVKRQQMEMLNANPDDLEFWPQDQQDRWYDLDKQRERMERGGSKRRTAGEYPSDDLEDVNIEDFEGHENGPDPDNQSGYAETADGSVDPTNDNAGNKPFGAEGWGVQGSRWEKVADNVYGTERDGFHLTAVKDGPGWAWVVGQGKRVAISNGAARSLRDAQVAAEGWVIQRSAGEHEADEVPEEGTSVEVFEEEPGTGPTTPGAPTPGKAVADYPQPQNVDVYRPAENWPIAGEESPTTAAFRKRVQANVEAGRVPFVDAPVRTGTGAKTASATAEARALCLKAQEAAEAVGGPGTEWHQKGTVGWAWVTIESGTNEALYQALLGIAPEDFGWNDLRVSSLGELRFNVQVAGQSLVGNELGADAAVEVFRTEGLTAFRQSFMD